MKKLLFIIFLLASTSAIKAQDDPEYLMEVGAGLGMVSYEGDFNGSILKDMQPMASLLMRPQLQSLYGLAHRSLLWETERQIDRR
jgi:hypothetical protein